MCFFFTLHIAGGLAGTLLHTLFALASRQKDQPCPGTGCFCGRGKVQRQTEHGSSGFCSEVAHVTSAHSPLIKAGHVVKSNGNEVGSVSLL